MNSEIFAFRCSEAKQLQERIQSFTKTNGLVMGVWIAKVLSKELEKQEKKVVK